RSRRARQGSCGNIIAELTLSEIGASYSGAEGGKNRAGSSPGLIEELSSGPSSDESIDRWKVLDRLSAFEIVAETGGKNLSPELPPGLYVRLVLVQANVRIPTFPLFRIKSSLSLLEPVVLKQ